MDRTVSIERIFVQGAYETHDILSREMLSSSIKLQQRIRNDVLSGENALPCVTARLGQCFSTDPLRSWNLTDFLSITEGGVEEVMSRTPMAYGFPIPVQSLLSGQPQEDDKVTDPDFLIFTYYFHSDDCQNGAKHAAWLKSIQTIASGMGRVRSSPSSPKLLSIQVSEVVCWFESLVLSPSTV